MFRLVVCSGVCVFGLWRELCFDLVGILVTGWWLGVNWFAGLLVVVVYFLCCSVALWC